MRAGPGRVVLREGGEFRLLCLPFAGGSARSFVRLARQLEGEWGIVAVQPPRGFAPGDEGADALARRYLDLLADDLHGPGLLLGHSLGAAVAHAMARLHGADWPDGLHVVMSAPPVPGVSGAGLLALDDEALLVAATGLGMLPDLPMTADFAARFLLPDLRADLAVLGPHGWSAGPLDVPVHLLGGDRDPACTPAVLAQLRQVLRPRTHRLLEGAGHMYVVDDPQRTAAALRDLRARVAVPQGG